LLYHHALAHCLRPARPAAHLLEHVVDARLVVVLALVLVVAARVGVVQRHKVV
jgi:hypothetical protein